MLLKFDLLKLSNMYMLSTGTGAQGGGHLILSSSSDFGLCSAETAPGDT